MKFRGISAVAGAAALCAMSATSAYAQSSVTVYGRVDMGVDSPRSGGVSTSRLLSGGSQGSNVGFRGTEDLGGGLSAIFRLEMGINADEGTLAQGGRGFGRESSVGLSSTTWGTVQMGRIPTPYYTVQSNVDAFAWEGAGGLLALTRNINPTTQRQVLPLDISARQDNSINYVTPRLGGFEFRAQGSFGEGSTAIGRGYGASGRYVGGPFDALVGFQRQNGASNGNGNISAFVIGGSYDAKFAKGYIGVTNEKNSCATCTGALARSPGTSTTEYRLTNLGVRVPLGAFTAIAQFTRVDDRSAYTAATGNRDANWISLGGDYDLSKRTRLYFGASRIGNRNGSQYILGTGTSQAPAGQVASATAGARNIYLGIKHNF